MKLLFSIPSVFFVIVFSLFTTSVFSQITGGFSPNDPLPKEAKAVGLGGYVVDGNVNTFTGEYSYSYNMGSVSTPGGVGYSLNMVYSSSHMTGSTAPLIDGIPYGTGWNVDVPYITADYSTLASYSQSDLISYMASGNNSNVTIPNRDKILKVLQDDGRLLWHEPVVHIPGVFSGKMIFKRFEGSTAIFVPFSFEKYLELHLLGSSFSVHLDDGTVYEFGVRKISYRNAPNKRIYGYNDSTNVDFLDPTQDSIFQSNNSDSLSRDFGVLQQMQYLPKPEVLKWYCTRITNKNVPSNQGVYFTYEKFGEYNFYSQFSKFFDKHLAIQFSLQLGYRFYASYGVAQDGGDDKDAVTIFLDRTFRDFDVHKDVILKQITSYDYFSNLQRINLNYKTKTFSNLTSNTLKFADTTATVHRKDSLYNYESVFYQGTSNAQGASSEKPYYYNKTTGTYYPLGAQNDLSGWKRILHVRHTDIQTGSPKGYFTPSKTNPYRSTSSLNSTARGFYQKNINNTPSLIFNHGILESPKITDSKAMVPGDLYELRTVLYGQSSKNLCLFDIEVKMDNGNYSNGSWANQSNNVRNILYSEFERGQRIYSTFSNAIKWSVHYTDGSGETEKKTRVTSDFFTMPMSAGNTALKIRIGPANSDNEFDWTPDVDLNPLRRPRNNLSNILIQAYQTYPANLCNGSSPLGGSLNFIKPSAPIAQNFGIGMPWWQTRNIYREIAQNRGYGDAYGFWWQDLDPSTASSQSGNNTWANEPTLADDNVSLKAVELIRYSKNTYCLDNVEVSILNGESSQFATNSGWTVVKKTQFNHENRVRDIKLADLRKKTTPNLGPNNESKIEYYNVENLSNGTRWVDSTLSTYSQNQIVLSEIVEIPINPIANRDSIAQTEIDISPTYHFNYTLKSVPIDPTNYKTMTRIHRMGSSAGGLLLTSFVNPLGGETKIGYHKYTDSETYIIQRSYGATDESADQSGFLNTAAQIVLPVKYIKRKNAQTTWLQTDYEYQNRSAIIDITKKGGLLSSNREFVRAKGVNNTPFKSGFRTVKVYRPENNGKRPYTLYTFNNTAASNSNLGITNGLLTYGVFYNTTNYTTANLTYYTGVNCSETYFNPLYGKMISTQNFDGDNVLQEKTEFTYVVSKAYENGVNRPYNRKKGEAKLDYFDYRHTPSNTDAPTYHEPITIRLAGLGNLDAPLFMGSVPYINLENNLLDSLMDSYFIRKTRTKSTVYPSDYCKYLLEELADGPDGFANPIGGESDQEIIDGLIQWEDEQSKYSYLQSHFPLSNGVLSFVIGTESNISGSLIKDVLVSQPDLTDSILIEVITNRELTNTTINTICQSVPYALTDTVQNTITNFDGSLNASDIEEITSSQEFKISRDSNATVNLSQNYTNASSNEFDEDHMALIDQFAQEPEALIAALNEASPVSDVVLINLVSRNDIESWAKLDILLFQPDLSDLILSQALLAASKMNEDDVVKIFETTPHVISDAVLADVVLNVGEFSESARMNIFSKHPYLSDNTLYALWNNKASYSNSFITELFGNTNHVPDSLLKLCIQTSDVFTALDIKNTVLNQSSPASETVLQQLVSNWDDFPTSQENELVSLLTDPKITISPNVDLALTNSSAISFSAKEVIGQGGSIGQLMTGCGNNLPKVNMNMESITDYEYYDANFEGISSSNGYKTLLNTTASTVDLAMEPSWKLFKTTSYSPQNPGVSTAQELYYHYDLKNRYTPNDIITYNWDETVTLQEIDTNNDGQIDLSFYLNELVNSSSIANGPTTLYPNAESIVSYRLAYKNNLRNTVYQKRSIATKPQSEPIIQSTYFDYHSYFPAPSESIGQSEYFSGPPCATAPGNPANNGGLPDGCFWFKYPIDAPNPGNIQYMYFDGGPTSYFGVMECPCGVINTSLLSDTLYAIGSNPVNLMYDYHENGDCFPGQSIDDPSVLLPLYSEWVFGNFLGLGNVATQIDTVLYTDYEHAGTSIPSVPLMEFRNMPFDHTYNPANLRKSYVAYPFDTLVGYKIHELTRWGTPSLVSDENQLYTKYEYQNSINKSFKDTNCFYNNYSSVYYPNVGLPSRVIVGSGHTDRSQNLDWGPYIPGEWDSLVTQFRYNKDNSVDSIIDPNNMILHYTYDDFGRLHQTFQQGDLIAVNRYHNWNNDSNASFTERAAQNYVESFTYTSTDNDSVIHSKKWVDPMGKAYNEVTGISADTNANATSVSLIYAGKTELDNWGRTTKVFKPFVFDSAGAQLAYIPRFSSLDVATWPNAFVESTYENDHFSRPLRTANFGLAINTMQNIKSRYKFLNAGCLKCELNLTPQEAKMIMPASGNYLFSETEMEDEDGKIVVEYKNASGLKIAEKAEAISGQKLVTLYNYDARGNLIKVINPKKQQTKYYYNIMNWMYRKESPDNGRSRYMYNKSGQIAIELDQNGQDGEPTYWLDPTDNGYQTNVKYYREYSYDRFKRLLNSKVVYFPISELPTVLSNDTSSYYRSNPMDPNMLTFSYIHSHSVAYNFIPSSWNYGHQSIGWNSTPKTRSTNSYHIVSYVPLGGASSTDNMLEIQNQYSFENLNSNILEASVNHSSNTDLTYSRGKLVATLSYGRFKNSSLEQNTEEIALYSYNNKGQLKWEIKQFNPNGISNLSKGLVTKIEYPKYNLMGSLLTMNVDIHADTVLDIQYQYDYDALNRLRRVYANFADSNANGNLLAKYQYNDAYGYLIKTEYLRNCSQNIDAPLQVVVDTINYQYDLRDRLTAIHSNYYDEDLIYDNAVFNTAAGTLVSDANYNGNINGTKSTYRLTGFDNYSSSEFDNPTFYGYQYDGINRLINADAYVADMVNGFTNGHQVGDVSFTYDKVGNMNALDRITSIDNLGTNHQNWQFNYSQGSNRMTQATGFQNTSTRSFTHDGNGNMISNGHKVTGSTYSRANLPIKFELNSQSQRFIYNASNQRVFNKFTDATGTKSEFHLRTATGQSVGILNTDASGNSWTWYVFGQNRFAKIIPNSSQSPTSNTSGWATSGSLTGGQSPIEGISSLISLFAPAEGEPAVNYPVKVYKVQGLQSNPKEYIFEDTYQNRVTQDEEYTNNFIRSFTVANQNDLMTLSDQNTEIIVSPMAMAAAPGGGFDPWDGDPIPDPIPDGGGSGGSSGPPSPGNTTSLFVDNVVTNWNYHSSTSLDSIVYYIHDHLGNTRLTYSASVGCGLDSTKNEYNVIDKDTIWTYFYFTNTTPYRALHYAGDYYPYGSVLRKHIFNAEKYLLTGNERDPESELDYFNARFYDSDFGRFNGVDPLADVAPGWSPYRAFYDNPVKFVDPTGMIESTHTDEDGNVIRVEDDGDNGVYKHAGKGEDALKSVNENYSASNTSAGGTYMGESLHSLSFAKQDVYNESGTEKKVEADKIKIDFGSEALTYRAYLIINANPTLFEYGIKARDENNWDIKKQVQNGSQLFGKYASPRDVGNFVAGAIAQKSLFTGVASFGYGAYELSGNNIPLTAVMTIATAIAIKTSPLGGLTIGYLVGKYGEDPLTQRSINLGKAYIKSQK